MTRARDIANLVDANGDIVAGALDNVPAADLVNDTTPQLGGNLDLNSQNITGSGNLNTTGNITATGDLSVNGKVDTDRIDFNTTRNVRIIVGDDSTVFGTPNDGSLQIQVDSNLEIVEADDTNQVVFIAEGNSGCVRHPTQPCFTATMSSNAAWGNSTAFAFNQTNVNNGNHFSTSNYRFTAPVAGVYYFAVNLSLAAAPTTSDDTMYWGFYKNGSQASLTKDNWWHRGRGGGNGVEFTSAISGFLSLAANDYVTVGATGISTTTGLVQGSGYSMFSGHLVA